MSQIMQGGQNKAGMSSDDAMDEMDGRNYFNQFNA